jgi:sulfite reductase (ferredoxin)
MNKTTKETKAQRVERIKREKDGLDVLADILEYAKTGKDINPEDIDRFKWYGLYTQNKNLQGEDTNTYYMLRIKIEQGFLTTEQLLEIASISKEFARDTADITTRQDIQLHWIDIKNLPEIFSRLSKIGLNTFSSGDCPRNIVSCPVNGSDKNEIDDVRDIVKELNDLYRANHEFSNLPRKFKIGVGGCHKHCISHEVQDLSFTAVQKDNNEIFFSVAIGGGQASNKRIASHIGYIQRKDIVSVAKAVVTLYNQYGRRDNRSKARLGHLLEQWGVKKFLEQLTQICDVYFYAFDNIDFTPYSRRSHFGVIHTKNAQYNNIGYAVTSGKIGTKVYTLAQTLKFYNAKGISFTTTQNIIVIGVEKCLTDAFTQTLDAAISLSPQPSVFEAKTLACTGLNFCKLAISETKNLAVDAVKYLNKKFPDFIEPISISINGCPNACAHPHIVDLGFIGAIVKKDKERIPGFNLVVGGHLNGEKSNFAIKTPVKVTPNEVPFLIESLILEYEKSNFAIKTPVKVTPNEVPFLIESLILEYEKSLYTNFQNFILEKYSNESNI